MTCGYNVKPLNVRFNIVVYAKDNQVQVTPAVSSLRG